MKIKYFKFDLNNLSKLRTGLFLFLIFLFSCKKEDEFLQVSTVELQIQQKINNQRLVKKQNTLVFQPLLFNQARKHSIKMANNKNLTDEGLDLVFNDLKSKIGGSNTGYILETCEFAIADSIFNKISSDPANADLINGLYTQVGIGISADADKLNYITVLFLNIPR